MKSTPTGNSRSHSTALALIPGLVVAALVGRCLTFPFLWDDFDFLGRSQHLRLRDLIPDPQTIFYRPLSREFYFGLLDLLGSSPLIGHLLNGIGLVVVIYLLISTVDRIAGSRAGFLAGLVFAGLSAAPILVGWVSGVQDVLAMILILASIRMEMAGRGLVAPILFAGALLSKETAVTFIPAVLLASSFPNDRPQIRMRRFVTYALLLLGWAAVHPGVRLLMSGGSHGGSGAYLASPSVGKLHDLHRGFLTLLNLPLGPGSNEDFRSLGPFLALAIAFVWVAYAWLRKAPAMVTARQARWGRLAPILGLSTLLPLLVTGLLVQHWSPYYACMAALGFAPIAGIFLARARLEIACLAITAYVSLGVWSRTVAISPDVTTEKNLRVTGVALSSVERGFKRLHSSLPAGSYIYVSDQATGVLGLYHHLYRFQPLRVWYKEPSLFVLDPNRHRAGGRQEFLFWIDSRLNVFEIDPHSLAPRTVGPQPDAFGYQKTLRTFALGRAAAGDIDGAVRILTSMSGRPREVEIFDWRAAAAILIASGRAAEAEQLLQNVPSFDRVKTLQAIFAMLAEPVPGIDLDSAAMEAFGISGSDVDVNRMLMQAYDAGGFADSAVRFAGRVLQLAPNDPEASQVLRKRAPLAQGPGVTVPIPHD